MNGEIRLLAVLSMEIPGCGEAQTTYFTDTFILFGFFITVPTALLHKIERFAVPVARCDGQLKLINNSEPGPLATPVDRICFQRIKRYAFQNVHS